MPSIHADVPGLAGGLGDGHDLVQQITAKGLQRVVQEAFDTSTFGKRIRDLVERDEDKRKEYDRRRLRPFELRQSPFEVRLHANPAVLELRSNVEMHIQGGDVLRGPLKARIPIRKLDRDGEPRVVLHCALLREEDVTLTYEGPRPREAREYAAKDHATYYLLGLLLQGLVDLASREEELNRSGLSKAGVDHAVIEAADASRSILSIRYAFNAHQDITCTQLKQWLQDRRGNTLVPGGGSSRTGGGTTTSFELDREEQLRFSQHEGQPVIEVTKRGRYDGKSFTAKARVPLEPDRLGRILADFGALKSVEISPRPQDRSIPARVLSLFRASGNMVAVSMPQYRLVGLTFMHRRKVDWMRLFISEGARPDTTAHSLGLVPDGEELALALDRRFVAGTVWDQLAGISSDLKSKHNVPGHLDRWRAYCGEERINIESMLVIEGYPDPAYIDGYVKPLVRNKRLEIEPHLNAHAPVTAWLLGFAAALATLIAGSPGIGGALFGLFLVGVLDIVADDSVNAPMRGSGIGLALPKIKAGGKAFGLEVRQVTTSKAGVLLAGRLESVMGESSHPLTVTGIRTDGGRIVAYELSSGQIIEREPLVVLVERGLQIKGVHVVHGRYGACLRADPDISLGNNLASLPRV